MNCWLIIEKLGFWLVSSNFSPNTGLDGHLGNFMRALEELQTIMWEPLSTLGNIDGACFRLFFKLQQTPFCSHVINSFLSKFFMSFFLFRITLQPCDWYFDWVFLATGNLFYRKVKVLLSYPSGLHSKLHFDGTNLALWIDSDARLVPFSDLVCTSVFTKGKHQNCTEISQKLCSLSLSDHLILQGFGVSKLIHCYAMAESVSVPPPPRGTRVVILSNWWLWEIEPAQAVHMSSFAAS